MSVEERAQGTTLTLNGRPATSSGIVSKIAAGRIPLATHGTRQAMKSHWAENSLSISVTRNGLQDLNVAVLTRPQHITEHGLYCERTGSTSFIHPTSAKPSHLGSPFSSC